MKKTMVMLLLVAALFCCNINALAASEGMVMEGFDITRQILDPAYKYDWVSNSMPKTGDPIVLGLLTTAGLESMNEIRVLDRSTGNNSFAMLVTCGVGLMLDMDEFDLSAFSGEHTVVFISSTQQKKSVGYSIKSIEYAVSNTDLDLNTENRQDAYIIEYYHDLNSGDLMANIVTMSRFGGDCCE
jgi:hypothetical protein